MLLWHTGACLDPGTAEPQRWCLTWISAVKSTIEMTQWHSRRVEEWGRNAFSRLQQGSQEGLRGMLNVWVQPEGRRGQAAPAEVVGGWKCSVGVYAIWRTALSYTETFTSDNKLTLTGNNGSVSVSGLNTVLIIMGNIQCVGGVSTCINTHSTPHLRIRRCAQARRGLSSRRH